MGSLFQGSPLPDVTVNQSSATTAPDYYTNYLTNLSQTGTGQVNQASADPSSMVAGFGALQQAAFNQAPSATSSYKAPMSTATGALSAAATPVTGADISAFYNPYEQDVVDEIGRQSELNTQRTTLPQLKAMFASTGASGSSRYANATGQTLSDIANNTLGQQSELRRQGFNTALNAALNQKGILTNAAGVGGNLANIESNASLSGLKAMTDLGGLQQAREQAIINAPMTTATNAAALLRGYSVPTSTSQSYKGPLPGAYSASPLQQIAGLAALLNGSGGLASIGSGLSSLLNNLFSGAGNLLNYNFDPANNPADPNQDSNPDANGSVGDVTGDPTGGGTGGDYGPEPDWYKDTSDPTALLAQAPTYSGPLSTVAPALSTEPTSPTDNTSLISALKQMFANSASTPYTDPSYGFSGYLSKV